MPIRRAGDEGALERQIQETVSAAGRSGLSPDSIVESHRERWSPDEIAAALADLGADGRLVEWNRRWIALGRTSWSVGRLQAMTGGDGLVLSGEHGEPGFFVARRHLRSARDGDLVLCEPCRTPKDRRGRSRRVRPRHRLPEGVVVKVLRRRDRVVGRVRCNDGYCRLQPFDRKLRLEIELSETAAEHEGAYVVAALEDSPGRLASRARGRVAERLGQLDEPGVDVLVALRHGEIPENFPEPVVAQAEDLPADPGAEDWAGRLDLRSLVTVTIDGETAKDFDDAISVEPGATDDTVRLGVHIADVSHYVSESSALDLEAYRRGTSVYFPERAVPMLPERLSNGLCSLRPDVPRLTMSAFLEIDRGGRVRSRSFAESVIRSHRRLTYEEVRRILEEPTNDDRSEYGEPVLALLSNARELMQRLLANRQRRGSIDFDLPAGSVILDTDGATVGVRPGERHVAHRIIEEFMIAANEAVAAELSGAEVPALHRIHTEPDRARILELRELLKPLGLDFETGAEELQPAVLQEVLEQVSGHAEEAFVSSLVLRSMKRATYSPEALGHYALATRHYTHFTSPIRRYPDLLVHRQLRNLLRGTAVEEGAATLLPERLPAIATHTSATERRAERAERQILQWKMLRLLQGREGEVFTGRVTGVQPYGLFVQLVDYYADGLVPVEGLSDDDYDYLPEKHRFVGRRTGRAFRLADELEVTLLAVDVHRRTLDLGVRGLAVEPRRRGRGESRRSGSGQGRRRSGPRRRRAR